MRVVTSEQMKQLERRALDYDLTFQRLMENAGSAAAAFLRRTFTLEGLNCMLFCGRGNNGGDGFVAARKLAENGANVLVVTVGGEPKSPEALSMFQMLSMMELPILPLEESREKILAVLQKADIVVDAVCGTGFHGELRDWERVAANMINDAIAAVIALDIPTGVECDSGTVAPGAVRADFTVAFDSRKQAHILPSSAPMCGAVEIVDIGIPEEARIGIDTVVGSVQTQDVLARLPIRRPDAHKGDFGRLLIVAGCSRYRGAASLATLAALRCGTGLVTLASTEPVCSAAAAKLYENVYLPLPQNETGGIAGTEQSINLLEPEILKSTAILFGCGMGDTQATASLLTRLLQKATCPVVIDADGINAIASNINILKMTKAPLVLTPHPGEMARVSGREISDLMADRYGAALEFARVHRLTLALKGHETVIASADGKLLVNQTGNVGLAKAGSGDVLAGMVAAYCALGLDPYWAAVSGVHLHGIAADTTAKKLGQHAMLPSDLMRYFPVWREEHEAK